MKFGFVHAEKANFPVRVLCRVLGVSPSGYYASLSRPPSKRTLEDRRLRTHVRALHTASGGVRGSPGIHGALRQQGERLSRKRVARLMREEGLRGAPQKRFQVTTSSDHDEAVAPNLVKGVVPPTINTVWVADITYVRTWEGWLYLAVMIDLASRRVVGWACANHMRSGLALEALRMALSQRRPPPGLVHHSDRGSQYASKAYKKELAKHGIKQSMSGKGNCYDNAFAESFFGTLKIEVVYRSTWPTRQHAARAISTWIQTYYNSRRGHSSLGYQSPMKFENGLVQSELAA